jgi:hypothetical protein
MAPILRGENKMLDFLKKTLADFGVTKKLDDTSPSGKIDAVDVKKLGVDALIVGVSAAIAYSIEHMAPNTFGEYQAFVVLGLSMLAKGLQKLTKDNSDGTNP